MIKFFGKIRHRLVSDNKVIKYMLYALGEIILVVIGIVIALEINNRSEEAKAKEKAIFLLTEVFDELEKNIINSRFIYKSMDATELIKNILDQNISKEEYAKNPTTNYLGYSTMIFYPQNGDYNNYYVNSISLPSEYQKVLPDLQKIYNGIYQRYDYYFKNVKELEKANTKYLEENFSWYSLPDKAPEKKEGFNEFKFSNYRYRNMIKTFKFQHTWAANSLKRFESASIKSYKEIGLLLGIHKDTIASRIDPEKNKNRIFL